MLVKANINWSAKQICKMAEREVLKFDNIIQRSYVWEQKRKSDLIHSMIEGYPIPPFYARKVDGKIYDFLDGKQRMNAIRGFINDEYYLIGIDKVESSDGEWIDINGKNFSELPEDIQDRIKDYSLTIYYYENITLAQTRELFRKLNNGKPLSTKERNIANCVDIVKVSELGQHELFSHILTEKALRTRKQLPIVMKIWAMLNQNINDVSFESKDFNELMQDTVISDEEKEIIVKVLDKILAVYNEMVDTKSKVARKRMVTEVHLVSLIPFFKKAIDENVSDRIMADFVRDTFTDKLVSDAYSDVCKGGSARNSSIKIRNDELEECWDEFFENLDDEEDDTPDEDSEVLAAISEEELDNAMNTPIPNEDSAETEYKYGMRLRGFSPMCQPDKGFLRREDDENGEYYDIIIYDRELSEEELNQFELDKLD